MSDRKQQAMVYWRKRWVRVLVAVPVLAAAIFGEYRLANIALPIEVDKTISPVRAALIKGEVLVVDNPFREVGQSVGGLRTELLPADDTTKGISIAAHFDSARLSDGNMERLRRASESVPEKKPPPPDGLQQIDYTTDEPEEDSQPLPRAGREDTTKPCSAAIALALADDTKPLRELHFFQPTDPSVGERTLEVKAVGADLMVQLSVVDATHPASPDPSRKPLGPGCSKTVSVGEWERSFTGPTQLEVIVPAGESFKVWFSPLPKQNPWPSAGDVHEPFKLVVVPPVSASGVSKISQGGSAPAFPFLKASSVAGEQPLLLNHFKIGAEELQLGISGKAMVQENGKDIVTFDVWKWMKMNPLIALLFSGLEVALINWVRLSFKKRSTTS
ncbi:MAG: hypothetical protein H7Z16_11460 [Pyrinomonadaceae bacterium]|nr:hypothetical protein [Pyrinomonadaceae bacterium]